MLTLTFILVIAVNIMILWSWWYTRSHSTTQSYPLGVTSIILTNTSYAYWLGENSMDLISRYGSNSLMNLVIAFCEAICNDSNFYAFVIFGMLFSLGIYIFCVLMLLIEFIQSRKVKLTEAIYICMTGTGLLLICGIDRLV